MTELVTKASKDRSESNELSADMMQDCLEDSSKVNNDSSDTEAKE
jgi:hypothetical protein